MAQDNFLRMNRDIDRLLAPDAAEKWLDQQADKIYQARRYDGKLLASQPESADPIIAVYFDAVEPWDEFDQRTINQLNQLAAKWARLPRMDAEKLRQAVSMYIHSGHDQTYSLLADVFVDAGYSVWLSETVFEVYRPEDISEEENVSEDELNESRELVKRMTEAEAKDETVAHDSVERFIAKADECDRYVNRALYWLDEGDLEQAVDYINKAAQCAPNDEALKYIQKAKSECEYGDFNFAEIYLGMAGFKHTWVVKVYAEDDTVIAQWYIDDRTAHEAEREARVDVERDYPGRDWTFNLHRPMNRMTEAKDEAEAEAEAGVERFIDKTNECVSYVNRALDCIGEGDPEQAVEFLRHAEQYAPTLTALKLIQKAESECEYGELFTAETYLSLLDFPHDAGE